ncbi:Prolamin_like domain-containing protein [Cephalotus follicularis]|uniref:Prolamin_like domain-containing protein n=1 Tax=Cephalotus follicularis TaxID=3775 RepID=A0A1Q3CP93_CEPFO|nr:Prolamin_like domain-containing protein [Cephalotus follicularis]
MSLIMLATCSVMLVQPGLAHMPTTSGLFPQQLEVKKCWCTLETIPGCVWEIYGALFSGLFGNVGPACCKAFDAIDTYCWPKMFPLHPFFAPLLKDSCTGAGAAPGPSAFD